MSNTCCNQLTVTGPQATLAHFAELFAQESGRHPGSLRSREPANPADGDKMMLHGDPLGAREMADWHLTDRDPQGDFWPGVHDLDIEGSARDGQLIVRFITGWDPPEAWLTEVRWFYESLRFDLVWVDAEGGRSGRTLWEPGMFFPDQEYLPGLGLEGLKLLHTDRDAGMALMRKSRRERLAFLRRRSFSIKHQLWAGVV